MSFCVAGGVAGALSMACACTERLAPAAATVPRNVRRLSPTPASPRPFMRYCWPAGALCMQIVVSLCVRRPSEFVSHLVKFVARNLFDATSAELR